MIAVDTNILLHAHREESPWHQAAFRAIAKLAEGRSSWGIPAPCFHEFLAIATHPRIFNPPTPLAKAIDFVASLIESPSLSILAEGDGYWEILGSLLSAAQVAGPKIHDARIAALCVYHRVDELWSADRDFGRFPKLRVSNPVIGAA